MPEDLAASSRHGRNLAHQTQSHHRQLESYYEALSAGKADRKRWSRDGLEDLRRRQNQG